MAPMSNRLLVPRKTPGLLDLVPGAAAAYSLRSLSRSYAGPVVTVRRSSDDAEDSFTASEVSDGTLAAFAGAGDGFVKTWHSQTGSNDATQTTAGYQPKIVSSGVLILEEGKPAIQFDGSDDGMAYSGTGIQANNYSVFAVFTNSDSGTSPLMIFQLSDGGTEFTMSMTVNDGVSGVVDSGAWYPTAFDTLFAKRVSGVTTGTQVQTAAFTGISGGGDFYLNSVSGVTAAVGRRTASQDGVSIGFQNIATPTRWFDGFIQELIIYPSDLAAQRELVEGLIAWGYSV